MPADAAVPEPLDFSALAPVSLAEVVERAAQLTRVDRKYLITLATAERLLAALPGSFRVLTIEDRTSTGYRSTYFDTADLTCCRAHIQQRRNRWKARSRLYVEDGLTRVDVKTRDARGYTVKQAVDLEGHRYGSLDRRASVFIGEVLASKGITVDPASLRPTAEVRYRRATLADTEARQRVTFDWALQSTLDGGRVWLDESWVLVETKGGLRLSAVDRALIRLGARPRSFSKYVSAASLLREDLPDNGVRHLHGRQLHASGSAPVADPSPA